MPIAKQIKSNFWIALLRTLIYTIFLGVLLFTDNAYNISDSKILAVFLVFSFSMEFLISGINGRCKQFGAILITSAILLTGSFLVYKADSPQKIRIPEQRIHFQNS